VRRMAYPMAWLFSLAAATALAAARPADTTHVLELPEGWHYAPCAAPPALDKLPDHGRRVALPHRQGTESCGVYRLSFAVPAAWSRHRVSLAVRAGGGAAWAWLNGQALGVRPPTALATRLDVSPAVRPGATNRLLVAIADTGAADRGGLQACWLEATGAVAVDRLHTAAWCLEGRALVDVRLVVGNHTLERFEGRLELALEPAVREPHHPVWRRGTDVRLDPGESAAIYHVYEIEAPRLWRVDDPYLYRLTATVQTRQREHVSATARRLGLRSLEVASGRWHVDGEWVRLAGIAFRVPGASLLCPQPGQAAALAGALGPDKPPTLPELLELCDERGIAALLDAPAHPDAVPGWREALDDLAEAAAWHPCVWGWVVHGEEQAMAAARTHLRDRTPRLPVGRHAPELADDARGFDFVLSRFATRAVRHDNDAYWRRLEDLKRTLDGKAIVCIDRLEPAEPGDLRSVARSMGRRRGEAAKRWPIAMLFFELDPDEQLYRIVENKLRARHLKPPRHDARLDRDAFVVTTRFEGTIASPVAQRIPCSSLLGYRLVWRAGAQGQQAATGTIALPASRCRSIERHPPEPVRGEAEWRTDKAGRLDFAVELHSPAGQVVAAHRSTLSLKRTRDGKAELAVGPPRVEEPPPAPPPPKPFVPPASLVTLDLTKVFNNDGISSEANPKDGNLDLPKLKSGSSYPADQLPEGGRHFQPPVPKGIAFRFPPKADGKLNNVACDGQRLEVPPGVYTRLWLLAAAEFGNQEGAARLVYDKGDEPVTLRLTDWCSEPAFGELEAIRCANRHTWDGQREEKTCRIWAVALALRDQPLQALVLPRNRHIHLFAATLVRATTTQATQVPLPFNNDGISWRANPKDGNLDLPGRRTGDTFVADLLPKGGALVPVPGSPAVTFRFPSKDDRRRNNVVCDGQRLMLPEPREGEAAPSYDAAWFLGACHDGGRKAVVTFQYAHGAEGQGELRLADWCAKPAPGQIDVLRTTARHLEDGTEEKIACGLVAWRIPLDPARKLLSITLPRERRMHVFALTLTRTVLVDAAAKGKE